LFYNNLEPSQLISRRLKGNVVPSINLPKRKHDKIINTPTKQKMHKRAERAKKRSTVGQDLFGTSNIRFVIYIIYY